MSDEKLIDCFHLGAGNNDGLYACRSKLPEKCRYSERNNVASRRAGYHCGLALGAHWEEHQERLG